MLAPENLSLVAIEIPGKNILKLEISDLPKNWQEVPVPGSTRDFGTGLLREARYSVIAIPSVVVPEEYNYLLNPLHKDHAKLRIVTISELGYDRRIKN